MTTLGRPGGRTVISASRREDLLAHAPGELAAILRRTVPDDVHTLVIWTKDPSNLLQHEPLRGALGEVASLALHLTVTGLGGTVLEPGVPRWRTVLATVPAALAMYPALRPENVTLRYDPLVAVKASDGRETGNLDPAPAAEILDEARRAGITRVRTSICTRYAKVERRMAAAGLAFVAGFEERAAAFLQGTLEGLCRERGMVMSTCTLPDRNDAGCIDGRFLTSLHPAGLEAPEARDRGQRAGCHCTRSLDVGRYRRCPHGCLYCYGNPVPVAVDRPRAKTGCGDDAS